MESRRRHGDLGPWLWGLLGLFLVRVAAQPAAAATGWPWLPPFEAWHSGALPYPALLTSQLVIAGLMAWAARGVDTGRTRPRPALGRGLAAVSGVYAAVMAARLMLGATVADGHWWLDAPLPTIFHLGLAAYLGTYARYHAGAGGRGRVP
jgi:hypothetical protein